MNEVSLILGVLKMAQENTESNFDPPDEVVPYNWPFPTYYGAPIVKRGPKPPEPAYEFVEAPF